MQNRCEICKQNVAIHNDAFKLKSLSNTELFNTTKLLVQNETSATLAVLHALREIEHRRAFAEKHYPSLFEFCIEFLGYKKGAAYRRILAMRALKEIPEIEEKVQNGSISLMTLSQAQSYFIQKKREEQPLSIFEKKEILETLENKSSRQTEQIFLKIAPKPSIKDTLKPLSVDSYALSLTIPVRVKDKLEKLKGFIGPEKAGVNTIEAIEIALDIAIRSYKKKVMNAESKVPALEPEILTAPNYISRQSKCLVWQRDMGQCTHTDPTTQQRCTSKFRLEMDHIKPKALGGSNEIHNIRLTCKAHNQWAAIQQLGFNTMATYIGESL